MPETFASLYTLWLNDGVTRNDEARHLLAKRYRQEWLKGDSRTLEKVLLFICIEAEDPGFDLVEEGIRSSDRRVAEAAVGVACSLMDRGFRLSSSMVGALSTFESKFPDSSVYSQHARDLLGQS